MPKWPQPENRKAPEGHYQFRLTRNPELKPFAYQTKSGERKTSRIVLYAMAIGDPGEFSVIDSILPFEDRYEDLLNALGVEHSSEIEAEGATFEADIKHEPDKNNPDKSYARISNITPDGGATPKKEEDDYDIPF